MSSPAWASRASVAVWVLMTRSACSSAMDELGAEPLESRNLPLDFLAAFPKVVQFSRPLQDWSERPQFVRGGFGAGDQRFERCGDVSPVRIDGDHRVVFAAATFQETDHWLLRGNARGIGRH